MTADSTPRPCTHTAQHRHGSRACYTADRCRCQPCSQANAGYRRANTRRNAYGRQDLVDAEPARRHIHRLLAAGHSTSTLLAAAGISGGCYRKLMYETDSRPPSRRIRRAAAARILATAAPAITQLPAARRIDATGTTRRLQALQHNGWSVARLAEWGHIHRTRLALALNGNAQTTVSTKLAVDRLYERLWNTPPPQSTPAQRRDAARVRDRAARLHWPAPLDIDDGPAGADAPDGDALDEIAVEQLLAGYRCLTGRAERREAARILTARGADAKTIAARLGITSRTVVRWRNANRNAAA